MSSKAGHSSTTFIPRERPRRTARVERDNIRVGGNHEPRDETRLGDEARRSRTADAERADPGRAAGPEVCSSIPPHEQGPAGPGMARTSWPSAVRAYLNAMQPYLAEGTLARKRKNLRTVHEDLRALEAEGAIRVRAPAVLSEREVDALLLLWRNRPSRNGGLLELSTRAKYLSDLEDFLAWCGNPVIPVMRRSRHVHFPRRVSSPIRILDGEELSRLRTAAEGIEGWPGAVARLLVALLPASGLRPKEIRLARIKDLELGKGRILVAHPKGEGSWAAPDYAPVPPAARPAVEDFLAEREAYLAGAECAWLVPYRRVSGEIGPWSEAMLRKLKAELAQGSGVVFSLRTFRPTFAQNAKDQGASIEAVSRALRHTSTRTTEAYYARIRADDAFHEIERAFGRPQVRVQPPT